ncbi:MAG: Uma2 family endonuclease, partial [Gemmataceae bacterium]|nr:Uma2 family endonuclease [Gemmataceae bacterium]
GAGVPLVWIIDPDDETVTVHELGPPPRLVTAGMDLVCEPHLPGFRVLAARLFS